MLEQQWHRDSLARPLVDDTPFAHKTGSVGGVRHDGGVLLPGTPDALTVHCFTDGPERDELVDDVGVGRHGAGDGADARAAGPRLPGRSARAQRPLTRRCRNAAVFVRFWHVVEQNRRLAFFDVST